LVAQPGRTIASNSRTSLSNDAQRLAAAASNCAAKAGRSIVSLYGAAAHFVDAPAIAQRMVQRLVQRIPDESQTEPPSGAELCA
jgi:hypothetical protein